MEMMQLKTHGPGSLESEWVVTSVADPFYLITGLLPQLTVAKKRVEFPLKLNISLRQRLSGFSSKLKPIRI